MATKTITATEFSRNLSEWLNQVRYRELRLEIVRGREVVARVEPPATPPGMPITELGALFAGLPRLSDDEARAFLGDIHAATGQLRMEDDAWAS